MKDISKTLIVGLGGTGQTMIRSIKKRLLRTYGEIPPLVKFVSFDTDDLQDEDTPFKYYYQGESREDFRFRINNNEFLRIPNPGIEAVERDQTCVQKLNLDELRRVSARLQNHGAGGYRVVGRAHFINAAGRIIPILQNQIVALIGANLTAEETARGYNVSNNGITVYVIASLAGGTGSSAFLDMSRMLQLAGINVSYNVGNAATDKIFGVFFLPKFFEAKPNTDNIRINAYTALSELDYTFDLADPTRHQAGSRELQEDQQDYQMFPGNNKRVIYDGIYLVDAITSKSQAHSLDEATNHVASFITASISADTAAITSSYVNSNHKMNKVDGKYQNYSGLGYCELRFNRQELVTYLLNKKLLDSLQKFKDGNGSTRAVQIAEAFIIENHLNEGVQRDAQGDDTRSQLNELTDAIINLNDAQFINLAIANVDVGKEADSNAENSKNRYLTAIGNAIQTKIDSFEREKDALFDRLRALLDEYMTGKGFVVFPDLAKCLKAMFTDMKAGLEDEVTTQQNQFAEIENVQLRNIKNTIAENKSRGIWFIGNKTEEQETALRRYFNKIRFASNSAQNPTLAWLKVDTARKREAISVYEEMIRIIERYYKEEEEETINGPRKIISGSYLAIDGIYSTLTSLLLRENSSYMPSKAAVNETVFADAYFKEYFESHETDTMRMIPQNEDALDTYIGSLFIDRAVVNSELISQMREELLTLLPNDGIIRRIREERMSIDDVFIHCYGTYDDNNRNLENNPQLQLLTQVDTLFETLWSYLNFAGQGLAPCKNLFIGVYDTQNHIFNNRNGYQATIAGWNSYQYINLGDPDRIVFLLHETAIPAFKLKDAPMWEEEFKVKRKHVYSFSDTRLEDIDMLMPKQDEQT